MQRRWTVVVLIAAMAVPIWIIVRQITGQSRVVVDDTRALLGIHSESISPTQRAEQARRVRAALDALPKTAERAEIVRGVDDGATYVNECIAHGCPHTLPTEAHSGPPLEHGVSDPPPAGCPEDATWHGEYYPFTLNVSAPGEGNSSRKQYWVWARDICSIAAPTPLPHYGEIIEGAVAAPAEQPE